MRYERLLYIVCQDTVAPKHAVLECCRLLGEASSLHEYTLISLSAPAVASVPFGWKSRLYTGSLPCHTICRTFAFIVHADQPTARELELTNCQVDVAGILQITDAAFLFEMLLRNPFPARPTSTR